MRMETNSSQPSVRHPSSQRWQRALVFKSRCKPRYILWVFSNCPKLVFYLQAAAIRFLIGFRTRGHASQTLNYFRQKTHIVARCIHLQTTIVIESSEVLLRSKMHDVDDELVERVDVLTRF